MSVLNSFLEVFPDAGAWGSHLWQSTLFVGVCWLAARSLKRNRASLRHAIWLAASLKFLFPVSILVGIGASVGEFTDIRVVPQQWSAPARAGHEQSAVQPAPAQTLLSPSSSSSSVPVPDLAGHALVAGWLFGAAVFALWGMVRWRRLAVRLGGSSLLTEGREADALRRVQSLPGLAKRVRLALSPSSVVPGVRGILRPVLFLPAGISDRLTDDQLETIIAHELCHVRRWDNLAAAAHAVVQIVFWFHPLVWWIGSRLVDERERSCDEDVLRMGNNRRVYASAILRVCEFYLAVPSATVSRATGSNLKTRIEDIMTPRIILDMGPARKLVLAGAALAFIASPVLFGMTTAPGVAGQGTASDTAVVAPATQVPLSQIVAAALAATPSPANMGPQAPPPAVGVPSTTPRSDKVVIDAIIVRSDQDDYRLRRGDQLDIVVWREPEISRQSVIRPDGKIGIPLVGDVRAEGRTPMGLQNEIRSELARFIKDPTVTVIVAATRKSQVTIQGAVVRPGVYVLEGRMTLLQLIAHAGGLSEFAKRDQITVFREEAGAVHRYLFNYGTFLAGTSLDQNIALQEDDIVIVP